VVIVGGGFGGLYTAQSLRRAPVEVTLVDRRNFHLFQPLLYQVATGGLPSADITSPLRRALRDQPNARVLLDEALRIDPARRRLILRHGELPYDTLVVAAGVANDYFGREDWAPVASGLKDLEDAERIRDRILGAFEAAEREADPVRRSALLTFVVVGGGATGVELAGAVGELAHKTLRGEFRVIDPRRSRVLLVEGAGRVLPSYSPRLSDRARVALQRLGVEVRTGTMVVGMDAEGIDLRCAGVTERLPARTVVWAAGVRGSPLGQVLADVTGCPLDPQGRVRVKPDLTLPGFPEVFVIGDLAHVEHRGEAIPCVAPAAIQEARYVSRRIRGRLEGRGTEEPFRYFDKGSLATIGRAAAVAEFHGIRVWGFMAWLAWLVIHLIYLIEFENRIRVLIQWFGQYLRGSRGARIITRQEAGP